MDDTISLQKQVRDNSEDLRAYLKDLSLWEEEMKRKESEILTNDHDDFDGSTVPIVRSKSMKTEEKKPKQRINSSDYQAWDKYDVEAECQKVDVNKLAEKSENRDNETALNQYQNQLRDESLYEKEKGNNFVRNKKWDEAIACYTHAIACYGKDPIFFANRALCFLKKENYQSAESDCTIALQLDPTYVKALQRRAAARNALKQYQEAIEDLKRVLQLEPHNKESLNELQKIEKHISECNSNSNTNTKKVTLEIKTEPLKKSIIPWPDRNGAEVVKPIRKLPHQRSKKPLRRIDLNDSGNVFEKNAESTITKEIESDIKTAEVKNEVERSEEFPIPKNSVQFYSFWKLKKNAPIEKFYYLKQISPSELPNIFRDSLESDIFSDIIIVLKEYFVSNNLPVYSYLKYLSNVKRFSALCMFMTQKEKLTLSELFQYCYESKNDLSKHEIDTLKKKYEL